MRTKIGCAPIDPGFLSRFRSESDDLIGANRFSAAGTQFAQIITRAMKTSRTPKKKRNLERIIADIQLAI